MSVSSVAQPRTLPAADVTAVLLAAVEHDRAELSASVHGGLVQSVLAARYLLDLLTPRGEPSAGSAPSPDAGAGDVRQQMMREAVVSAVVEGRRLLARLKPGPAERELSEALAALAETRDGVRVTVTGSWPGSGGSRLPAGGAAVLHRVVQAAVERAADGGARVRVLAAAEPLEVRVEVCAEDAAAWGSTAGAGASVLRAVPGDDGWGGTVTAWGSCLTALGGRLEAVPGVLTVRCPLLRVADGEPR